jgi:hypothetical protein
VIDALVSALIFGLERPGLVFDSVLGLLEPRVKPGESSIMVVMSRCSVSLGTRVDPNSKQAAESNAILASL